MKSWFKIGLLVLFIASVSHTLYAFDIPSRPNGFVQDYANVLNASDKSALESKLTSFEKQTTNEIAVVIIPSLDGDTIENVAQNIFTKWGIGKKDKNNGALFLIAMAEHKSRIHTGYGLEGTLTDIGTSYIQREVAAPAFKVGDYALGINGAVDKMIGLINGGESIPADYTPSSNASSGPSIESILQGLFFVIIILQWIFAVLARSKSWWAGGIVGIVAGIIVGFIFTMVAGIIAAVVLGILGLLLDYVVSKNYDKYKASGQRMPWFIGGGGFGGHGGGGFGGFGGGSSGGGGSSNSW